MKKLKNVTIFFAAFFCLNLSLNFLWVKAASSQQIFSCKKYQGKDATFITGGSSLIIWDFKGYTGWDPNLKCPNVTKILNRGFANNRNMIATGDLARRRVLCLVKKENEPCNTDYVIYYLTKDDERNPQQALGKFLKGVSFENTPPKGTGGSCRSYIDLKPLLISNDNLQISTVCKR